MSPYSRRASASPPLLLASALSLLSVPVTVHPSRSHCLLLLLITQLLIRIIFSDHVPYSQTPSVTPPLLPFFFCIKGLICFVTFRHRFVYGRPMSSSVWSHRLSSEGILLTLIVPLSVCNVLSLLRPVRSASQLTDLFYCPYCATFCVAADTALLGHLLTFRLSVCLNLEHPVPTLQIIFSKFW